jgi:hypothetical protein
MPEKVLFVAPYPPPFDDRTRAAVEHVRDLRRGGHAVEVLSAAPSAAHHHHDPGSWRSVAPLVVLVRRADRVVVAEELVALAPLRAALRAARAVEIWHAPSAPRSSDVDHDVVWPSERDAAMAEIRARAARSGASDVARDLSARIRRVPALALPTATSPRPGAGSAKRTVRRLTSWEIDPIVGRVNELRAALIDVLEALEQRDVR